MDNKSFTVDLHRGNEIVVDQDHLQLVEDELINFGVKRVAKETDGRLGLGRMTLEGRAVTADLATTDPGLTKTVESFWDQALDSIRVAGGPQPTNLDVCLKALRLRFADCYGGWYPTMGKNRDIADIEGLPYISGGGSVSKVPTLPNADYSPGLQLGDSPAGTGVRVGIADTPIYANPRLVGRYLNLGVGFRPEAQLPPAAGHSTFIAGLILQRAPRASLIVRPVLDMHAHSTSWGVATSLMGFLAEDSAVDVLPLALGTYARDGQAPLVLARAIERLAPHTVVLAAAGNHGEEKDRGQVEPGQLTNRTVTFPAALEDVCAVAADGPDGKLAEFSPPLLPWMQLAAPGVDLLSTYLDARVLTKLGEPTEKFDGLACWSGSSFAVATVAGEIARRTVPGRVTARQALEEILAGAAAQDGIRRLDYEPAP